jgi:uncharacterized protein YjdB
MPKIVVRCSDADLILIMNTSARAEGLNACLIEDNTALRILTDNMIGFDLWISTYERNPAVKFTRPPDAYIFKPYLQQGENKCLLSADYSGKPYYNANQLATIYNFPPPNPETKVVVGVLSFGGGLYGTVDSQGVLTDGDVQQYWSTIGIPSNMWPTVVIVPIGGATNNPNDADGGATNENSLDVEIIGACCPSPNLTIILYIAPNSLPQFSTLFSYALNTPVLVNGVGLKPSIFSISWGAPEIFFSSTDFSTINTLLSRATAAGINICTATGGGVGAGEKTYCHFPSSSPFVTAVGGTTLTCPDNVYNNLTVERTYGVGGVSTKFAKPAYQSEIVASGRVIPDIALNGDPATGVVFIINGMQTVLGGTSMGAPLFASFLAATNVKTFINPKLYTAGQASFNTITESSRVAGKCAWLGSINGLTLSNTFNNVLATHISLDVESLALTVGQETTINYTLQPDNVTLNTLAWCSDNSNIVSVNSAGVVTGVSVGAARITCGTIDNSNISISIPVTVTSVIPVYSVVLASVPSIHVGSTIQLNPVISPNNASNKSVSWISSDPSVASVSETGLVSGLTFGTCVITCTGVGENIQTTVEISVTIPAQIISVEPATLIMRVEEARQLIATVGPPNTTNMEVTWSSVNKNIAVVNAEGTVIGRSAGTTIISAISVDTGISAQCTITIV